MVSFFPTLYKDELLYSAIARYHIRTGNISPKATLDELYNSKTVSAVVELPSNIDNLIDNMPINNKYTAHEFIYNHTMFPFYTVFLSPERKEVVYNLMKGKNGGDIYNRVGLMATSISSNKYFKFCTECVKEDKLRYGELYWHRIHQIPGISICSKHKIPLLDSKVLIHSENKHEYIYATEENCLSNEVNNPTTLKEKEMMFRLNKVMNSKEYLNKLCILNRNVELLLNRQYRNRPSLWFWSNYNNKLRELEFANVNGKVKQEKLISNFTEYYGEDLLYILQSVVNPNNESNWLSQIVRKHRKTFHPIRHLLLMQFLGIALDEVFNKNIKNEPFGEAPWPCLNAGAEHYLEPVVDDLKITYDSKSKKTIGTFTCTCGFVYSRSGPDVDKNDRYSIGRIKNFGSVWEDKLRSLVQEKLSLRQIARELKVDPITVDKYAEKLGLELYWRKINDKKITCGSQIKNIDGIKDKEIKNEYRSLWLQLIENNPDKSKTELRKINNRVYTWLYRNDKKWFDKHTIKMAKRCKIVNRIDWKKRDEDILTEVINIVETLLNTEEKPERVTISKVGKKIGKLSLLEKHLDKLPLTKIYLQNHIENVESFQKRRIKWAIDELEKEGEEVKAWKVMRKAGIKNLQNRHIKHYLNQLIYLDYK